MNPGSGELLAGYDAFVNALIEGLDGLAAGDHGHIHFYIVEPGDSSEAVLTALVKALQRGAQVRCSIDCTRASWLSRFWENTETLLPRLREVAEAHPDTLTFIERKTPDHSKFATFEPSAGPPTLLMGSTNLSDRFRGWRDLGVRFRGVEAVEALREWRSGKNRAAAAVPFVGGSPHFFGNAPLDDHFAVEPTLETLLADPELERVQVAMAYVDRTGISALAQALDRDVPCELLFPRTANVYTSANLRRYGTLLERYGQPSGPLSLRLLPGMLHAKAFVFHASCGHSTVALGSANLKRHSFRLLGELCVLTADPGVVAAMSAHFDSLWSEAEAVTQPPHYRPFTARLEEFFG